MRVSLFILASWASVSSGAAVDTHWWASPTAGDRRSPCPMLNTLANHGYLPRSGVNISMDDLINGLSAAVNLDGAATQLVGAKALSTSTTGNASTFNLDDLDKHGILEHDGSLSRNDIYFGDNHSFNSEIWDTTLSWFTNDTISIATAAAARSARLKAAAAVNPEFSMTATDVQDSFIESALYLAVFGNTNNGEAVTEWVRVMFEQERLPCEEGFTRPSTAITTNGVLNLVGQLVAATS